jgi:hypothetical protein
LGAKPNDEPMTDDQGPAAATGIRTSDLPELVLPQRGLIPVLPP